MDSSSNRRTVLVVEDDPDYASLLREAFTEAGFQTLQAVNGENALQLLRKQHVDLVVSDFMMPELNGLELCRLLSDDIHAAAMKIVLYSANTDPTFRKRARELGAVEYLPKSEQTDDFVGQICNLLGWISREEGRTGHSTALADQALQAAAGRLPQLNSVLGSLMDFLRIASLSGELPKPARMALEAAERAGLDIKQLLGEVETALRSEHAAVGGADQR